MPKRRTTRSTTTALIEAKPWQESRSIWLAVLSVVVPVAMYAADNALALGLPDKAIPWIALFVFAAGSIRQRFETTQPIGQAGEMVPVDGAATALVTDLDDRKLDALAAAIGAQHNDIERLENALLDLRADTGLHTSGFVVPEDPERISTRQISAEEVPFRG